MLVIVADARALEFDRPRFAAVRAAAAMADLAQRRRADGREAVLPDARFVAQ